MKDSPAEAILQGCFAAKLTIPETAFGQKPSMPDSFDVNPLFCAKCGNTAR